MRIVYLHQYFKTPDMAGGTRSYEMARRFVEWGHEVHIVTSSTGNDGFVNGWRHEVIDGINVHWLSVPYNNSMGFIRRLTAFCRFAFYAGEKAASIPSDLIFATSTPLTIALPAVFASRKQGVPMVFEVRDLWPAVPIALGIIKNSFLCFLAKKMELFAYNNSARVVALSQGMADGVAATGYPPEKITVISNSSDLELFDPSRAVLSRFRAQHPFLPPGPLVLYPGTLGQVNGIGYLVDVAAEMLEVNSEISFVIIGDGKERSLVEKKAEAREVLGRNFFILDSMPKKMLVDAFHDSSLIVSFVIDVPELEANSANKFFDALAAFKPIGINHGGWQKAVIEQKEVGLYLSRDANFAANSIASLLSDTERFKKVCANAGAVAKSDYSRDTLARKLESVLIEALTDFRQ